MELYIRLQLQTMGAAFGLGCGAMLVYDLLRTVRLARRQRAVTHVTDLLYVLGAGGAAAVCAALRRTGRLLQPEGAGAGFSACLAVLAGGSGADGAVSVAAGAAFLAFLQKSMAFGRKSHCLFEKKQ